MNKNKYFHSVLLSPKPKKYSSPIFPKKENLEQALRNKGLKITLKESLKGGFFSKVYSAELNNQQVVVKYIDSIIPLIQQNFL